MPEATAAAETYDLAEHVRDGLWRVDTVRVPGPGGLVVVGERAAVAGARIAWSAAPGARPVEFYAGARGEPPLDDGSVVYCASYAGEDEGALAALEAAVRSGSQGIVATTGGSLASRARAAGWPVVPLPAGFSSDGAIGYWVSIAAEIIAGAGRAPSLRADLESAAALLDGLRDDPEPESLARELGDALSICVLADESSPVAARVASRLLDVSGVPAVVVAPARLAALPAPVRERLTARGRTRLIAFEDTPGASVLRPRGETPAERALSVVFLADMLSYRLI